MTFLIDTNLIRAIHLALISERRVSIVTSPRTKFIRRVGLPRIESKRVCTTRGDNDRHRRNRTEREGRKGDEGEKKPKRDSAERNESMKASGFVGGEREGEVEGGGWGRVRVDADIAVGQVRFCLNGESGYRMIHIVRAPFEPPSHPFPPPVYPLASVGLISMGRERRRERGEGEWEGGVKPELSEGAKKRLRESRGRRVELSPDAPDSSSVT